MRGQRGLGLLVVGAILASALVLLPATSPAATKKQKQCQRAIATVFTFKKGGTNLVELTLPHESPCVGQRVRSVRFPGDGVLVAIVRDGQARTPDRDAALEGGDELLFLVSPQYEEALARVLSPRE